MEAVEKYLNGSMSGEDMGAIYEEWHEAYEQDEVIGSALQAVEDIVHMGYTAAASVAAACAEAVGAHAARHLPENATGDAIFAAWEPAELAEKQAQADLLRELFGNPFQKR